MQQTITKAQRWLDLVVFLLRHRYPVTVEQVMESVPAYLEDWSSEDETRRASVRRKFERDKDELRKLGIPIESVNYTIGYGAEEVTGYRLSERELYLPRLVVQGDEPERRGASARGPATVEAPPETWSALARAAARVARLPESPLAPYGRSALRKLGFDLPELAEEAEPPFVHYLSVPDPAVSENLAVLTEALLERKHVGFEYYSISKDERRRRTAEPYGLIYQGGHWYLIARDPEADAIRTFRVSRMGAVEVNPKAPKTADYEVPDGFRLRDYVGREAWQLGAADDELAVEALFLPPTSQWADVHGLGEYLRADEPTGGQVRRFRVRQLDPFLRWCLTFRGQVRPVAPPAAAAGFRGLVRQVLALYEGAEAG